MFDSMFESGNLLQADRSATNIDHYNLFMQVDTNTRGHQQWFYFRCTGGVKGKTYTFNIMNFTKPGVSGGRGYKANEHQMRIVVKSKKKQAERLKGDD
jgi:cytosolic carboxypeptidase protein 2/3